jgi:anaerobic magnesium-protoporphyrin IX monomethyl ester cyclase
MNVLLINPSYADVYKLVSTARGKTPPITLAYLAAYLRERGHRVHILDAENLRIGVEEIEKFFPQDTDIVGVSSMTPSFNNSLKVLKAVKHIKPSCITVMGGPHITALPEEVMREAKNLDFGVLGEGEETLAELLDWLSSGRKDLKKLREIKGITFRDNQSVIITQKRDYISNLDSLPMPAYDLLDMSIYELKPHQVWSNKKVHLKPYTNLFTSRGCLHSCTYCASNIIWGRKARFKSSAYVLREINILVNEFGIKSISICDDSFLLDKDRAIEILDGIINRNYDLNFCCFSRVDEVNEDLLYKLKHARCHLIRFGVESCSQKILDAMKKGYKVNQIRKVFKLCKKVGIAASACIIIGYPGETKESFNETLRTLKEIDPVGCDFFIAIPIVGTEFYEMALRNGYLVKRDWSEWIQLPDKPLIKTEHLTPQELLVLRKKALLDFYFRPYKIWQIVKNLRSAEEIRYYLNGLCAILGLLRTTRIRT